MYCKYCGGQVVEDAVVCIHCGRQLRQVQSVRKSSINSMCLAGFIMSLASFMTGLAVILGLIFSIIGYNQTRNTDDSLSKNLGRAGIIISSVILGLVVIIVVMLLLFSV